MKLFIPVALTLSFFAPLALAQQVKQDQTRILVPDVKRAVTPTPIPKSTPKAALTLRGTDFGWLDAQLAKIESGLTQIDPPSLKTKAGSSSAEMKALYSDCYAIQREYETAGMSLKVPYKGDDAKAFRSAIFKLCDDLKPARADLEDNESLLNFEIQDLMSQTQKARQLAASAQKAEHDTQKAIIKNIK